MRNIEVTIVHDDDFVHVEIREPIIRKFRRTYKVTEYALKINKWMKLGMDGVTLFDLEAKLTILYGKREDKPSSAFGGNARHWKLVQPQLKVYAQGLQSIYDKVVEEEQQESNKLMDKAFALPGMMQKPPPCPVCKVQWTQLAGTVMHLNDNHKWTREKIAYWMQDMHDEGVIDISFKVSDG